MRSAICFLAAVLAVVSGNPVKQPEVKRGPYGFFSSPNYPDEYGNDQREEWVIRVREGYHIKFRFTSFDLEDSYEENEGPCVYDYVLVTEGSKTIGRFCGNAAEFPWDAPRTNEWFRSKGNETRVLFVSDYSNEGISPSGFNLHYVEEDNDECAEMKYKVMHTLEDWDELIVCDHFCNNVPGRYYCSCRNGYKLHENRHTCVAVDNCINQTLIADDGVIQSPAYPNPYAKLSHCSWDIMVRDGLTILLTFDTNFGVEEHDEERCVYDILKVNDQTYCGSTAPNNGSVLDMGTRHVVISFKTDLSVEQQGFRIVYNTSRIRCKTPLTDPLHGSIASQNSKGYYEFEDEVTFECDTGYNLNGTRTLECLSDGSWNAQQPRCLIKSCGRPENLIAVSNSHIIDFPMKRFTYGETVTVQCNDWYDMTAGIATWRCHESTQWVRQSRMIAENGPSHYPKCRPICGKKNTRVRRGSARQTLEHEFPWLVFLNYGPRTLSQLSHGSGRCTGNLISPRYVLTAAHCLYDHDRKRDPGTVHAWIGVHDKDDQSLVRHAIAEKIISHRQYKVASRYDHDVGLIRLDRSITMGNKIRPICLPSTQNQFNSIHSGVVGEVSGWSLFSDVHRSSKILLKGSFPVVDNTRCWTSFRNISNIKGWNIPADISLNDNMFCAGYEDDDFSSTCDGDSGAPFMMEQNSIIYASGLVSWGLEQACDGGTNNRVISYTVYARLSKPIVDWIHRETNRLE